MKRYILNVDDIQDIVPQLRSKSGALLLQWLFRTCKVNEVNDLYGRNCSLSGAAFANAILDDLNITCQIDNEELLDHLPKGSFVTVSNHPFGALDGVILIKMLAAHRPDYKVMANWILKQVEALADNFIAVDPKSTPCHRGISLNGIRETLSQVNEGHPLGFFPAGAVSMLTPTLSIEDQAWRLNIMRLIQQIKRPVIPIFFHGHNSYFFNLLGLINWNLRSLRLPIEILKKTNKTIRISVGNIISPETIAQYPNPEELGAFLKRETYQLKKR